MSNETNFHEIRQILLNKYHINIVFKKMNEMVAGPRLNGHCFEQVKKTMVQHISTNKQKNQCEYPFEGSAQKNIPYKSFKPLL